MAIDDKIETRRDEGGLMDALLYLKRNLPAALSVAFAVVVFMWTTDAIVRQLFG